MSALLFSCPACGRALSQKHPEHRLLGCVCGKAWYLDAAGKLLAAMFSKDLHAPEPWRVQIGTTGRSAENNFEVVGRVLVRNEDTIFHYWTVVFEDGNTGMLAEGYGFYGLLRRVEPLADLYLSQMEQTAPGEIIQTSYSTTWCRLARRVQFSKVQLEGSCLWSDMGTTFRLFEVHDPESGRAFEIFDFPDTEDWFFERTDYEESALSFQNLLPEKPSKEIHCAACYKKITLQAWPFTKSVVCPECRQTNVRDLATGGLNKKPALPSQHDFQLQIGDPVALNGLTLHVVGMARKAELLSSANVWDEYTIYHPAEGFAYLSVYNGHWTYVKERANPPQSDGDLASGFEGQNQWFEPFNRYRYQVLSAAGEHIYDLHDTRKYHCKEFIHPPQTFVSETTEEEQVWFSGKALGAHEVEAVLGSGKAGPRTYGRSHLFRNPVPFEPRRMTQVALALSALMIVVHLLITLFQSDSVVTRMTLQTDTAWRCEVNSEPFRLWHKTNLVFEITAPLENSWVYVEGTLVNRDNGREISFSKTLEYYHGVDDGESWSEGDRDGKAVLNELERGTYFLNVQAQADPSQQIFLLNNTNISIRQDVPNHWNLLHGLLVLWGVWTLLYLTQQHYEKIRFEGSPYDRFTRE